MNVFFRTVRSTPRSPVRTALLFGGVSMTMAVSTAVSADIGLDLVGEIPTRCELLGTTTDSLRFDVDARAVLGFELYCNVEMSLTLVSTNGGLLNAAAAGRRESDDSLLRRYTATVAVDSLGFTRALPSESLLGGETLDAGSDIAFASVGSIAIELDEPLGDGYAGEYVDEIRLSVFPSMGAFN